MLALNKTKAALPGRLSHFSNVIEENNTAISLVNLSRSAGAGNYGKSTGVTAAMAQFLIELQICNSPNTEGVRHWLIPPIANLGADGVLQRSAATSPKFSGDLQSAEKPADAWLAEKPADQPLGSIPRVCSSFLRTRFIQVARDESPSFLISASSCARNSCWRRIWYWSVFTLSLDIVITKSILSAGGCNYNVTEMVLQLLNTAKPRSALTLAGPLTKTLIEVTVMAESQHTQTHPEFTWRFLAVSKSYPQAQAIVVYTNAPNEAEARSKIQGCILYFAARLPAHHFGLGREVNHA